MNLKHLFLTAAITTCIVTTAAQAKADTYKAGKFTVRILYEESKVVSPQYIGERVIQAPMTNQRN